jgi:hypothetical protein
MAATSEKKTGEVQISLFGGEVARKRRPKDVRIAPTNEEREKGQNEAGEPPQVIPDYATSPVVHRMYVDRNLRSVVLTGRQLGMPPDEAQIVFDEDGPHQQPKACRRLTPELFRDIIRQLDGTTAADLGEERAAVLEKRWSVIVEWARAEGWL